MSDSENVPHIGTLNEKSLHVQLKEYLAQEGDQFEVPLDGSVIDIMRGSQLIEVQTRHLGAMKSKLKKLLPHYKLHLVHPITAEKWLVKHNANGRVTRRKSPKKGNLYDIFGELVFITTYIKSPNFSLEVLITTEEEHKRPNKKPRGRWGRAWHTEERKLLTVTDSYRFEPAANVLTLLPDTLPELFTTADLAKAINRPRNIAQKMSYTLFHSGLISREGKRGRAFLYCRL